MTTEELIGWIHAAQTFGEKNGLENMRRLLKALGNPERSLRLAQVAGTNGKGSVSAMLEAALRANGLRTGLYTSPYLTRYNERIRINGESASDALLVRYGEKVYRAAKALNGEGIRPTSFELGTALAYLLFAGEGLDFCVIETGLGGRLDPTNTVSPRLSVITGIAMDHMEQLGDTLEKIAGEKAGIIKPGAPVVLEEQEAAALEVFVARARETGSPLVRADAYPLKNLALDARGSRFAVSLPHLGLLSASVPLPGAHQAKNARLSLLALDALKAQGFAIDPRRALQGLAEVRWPGRLEYFGEDILLDGAHNPNGVAALMRYLNDFVSARPIVLLTGMMADKQPESCARLLAPRAELVIATRVQLPRALPAESLARLYRAEGAAARAVEDIPSALAGARAEADKRGALLLAAGSLYLIGALRGLLCEENISMK